jgi:hypothetical protein
MAIRRRVRAVAFAWLLCQVASLSAFVPEQCCVSHVAEAEAKKRDQAKAEACHEAPAPEPEPKEGDACPMHHGTQSHDCCAISNACDGPGTHLLTLFSFVSTIDEPGSSSLSLESTAAFVAPPPPLLHRLALPDAPPPKR